jgi:hypothetical protein
MKWHVCVICLAVSALWQPGAEADEIALETGRGVEYSNGDIGTFLQYRREAPPLYGFSSYFEFTLAYWNGVEHDSFIAASRGLNYVLRERTRATASFGAGYLDRKTDRLGTRAQFMARLGIDHDYGAYTLGIGATHISNGSKVFRWDGPNKGENYLTLRVATHF